MARNLTIDIIGWVGVVGLLAAYAAVSMRKVEGDASSYQLLNIVGGVLLIANSFYYGAYPSVGLNVVWVGIGVVALLRRSLRSPAGP